MDEPQGPLTDDEAAQLGEADEAAALERFLAFMFTPLERRRMEAMRRLELRLEMDRKRDGRP